MALHIRDIETDHLVRRLADIKQIGLTEAVKLAVENELRRTSFEERLAAAQARVAALGDSGLTADKAFYDSLNDE